MLYSISLHTTTNQRLQMDSKITFRSLYVILTYIFTMKLK